MTKFHPDARYLTDYAAGSLAMAPAVAVSVHLEYCAHCRQRLASLIEVGASVFQQETQDIEDVSEQDAMHGFDALLSMIDEQPEISAKPDIEIDKSISESKLVSRLIDVKSNEFSWKKLTKKLAFSRLSTGDTHSEVGLYHIFAGGSIPEHKHQGEEITVVLKGTFTDADGIYQPGDFLVRQGDERHSPQAGQHEDCICLAVVDAPVQFTKGLSRLVNPFLSVNPH
jgi:putative transcriptional regulator